MCVYVLSVTMMHGMHSTTQNRHDKGPPHLHLDTTEAVEIGGGRQAKPGGQTPELFP